MKTAIKPSRTMPAMQTATHTIGPLRYRQQADPG